MCKTESLKRLWNEAASLRDRLSQLEDELTGIITQGNPAKLADYLADNEWGAGAYRFIGYYSNPLNRCFEDLEVACEQGK